MKLYDSLSRRKKKFIPIDKDLVGIYTCGPTVYNFLQIGNWRTYVLGDVIVRSLKYLGFNTKYVMNITDVGHLVSDGDEGEDKLEKGAKREGKTAWDVADMYTKDFRQGMHKMGLLKPEVLAKATSHIKEQIDLVEKLEKKGFAYKTSDGMYFDTQEFEKQGNKYGELSTLDQIQEGVRVEINKEKKNERDFALWKFSPEGKKRDMEWESPWGKGFPGWHIECSAMSMKYLGEQFDLHVGGEDLRSTHHPNEIAQSEGATGKKPFVKCWIHGAFLLVDGGKMGKSLGNAYTLHDLVNKGFSPVDLKYFYLGGHYRKQLNFTWEALEGAKTALGRLKKRVADLEGAPHQSVQGAWEGKFKERVGDDLDMPGAMAVVWEMVKDKDLSDGEKLGLIGKWDEVFGLGLVGNSNEILNQVSSKGGQADDEVTKLVKQRSQMRLEKKWEEADRLREEIEKLGYVVEDQGKETVVVKA